MAERATGNTRTQPDDGSNTHNPSSPDVMPKYHILAQLWHRSQLSAYNLQPQHFMRREQTEQTCHRTPGMNAWQTTAALQEVQTLLTVPVVDGMLTYLYRLAETSQLNQEKVTTKRSTSSLQLGSCGR